MTSENTFTIENFFHHDLIIVKELLYDRCGMSLINPKVSKESVEYGACSFELNGKFIQHRVSKITPTKGGQFVTIWKRSNDGLTKPFDDSDNIDFIIITARMGINFGQFIFPRSLLIDKAIISHNGVNGKRGIRVYPPWDVATNKQAKQTQSWQRKYFLQVGTAKSLDLDFIRQLFCQDEIEG